MSPTLSALFPTIAAWVLIFPCIFALGRIFQSCIPTQDQLLRGICSSSLGMILLSYGVVALSYLHLLKPAALWGVIGVGFLLCFVYRHDFFDWMKSWSELFTDRGPAGKILAFLAFALFAGLLIGTLTPEIGGDTLTYQIDLPKEFLRRGSINPIPYNDNSYFPLFMNNLYLVGLATGGVYAAKLFHFLTGLFLSLGVARTIQIETQSKKIALYAGATLLATPVLYNMLSTTYLDVSVAFFIFLALTCLTEAFKRNYLPGFFLSGIFAGITIAAKYLSLTGVLALALTAILYFLILERRNPLKQTAPIALWIAGGLIACGYWLLRNWIYTGNPFYPYWGFLFGLEQRPPINYYDTGVGKNLYAYFFALFNMAVQPDKFGAMATRISLIYFFLLPFAAISAFKSKNARPYLIFFVIFYTIWFFVVQMDRWFISALGPLMVTGAIGMALCDKTRSFGSLKKMTVFLCLMLLTVETAAGIRHYRYAFLLYSGQWSLADYETRMERTVPIARWINANTPADAVILIESEPRKFYIKRTIIEDKNLDWQTHYHSKATTPAEIRDFIKAQGVTHLLLSDSIEFPGKEPSFLKQIATPEYAQILTEISSQNIRDEKFVYQVYALTS